MKKKKKKKLKKKKKKYDPRLYDTEKMELVDFGEHSYQKLLDSISQMNGIMWLGRLSPSKCENMFDNYIKIINKINFNLLFYFFLLKLLIELFSSLSHKFFILIQFTK